ncbi:MAG: nitrate reductase [Acidiferrobacter sp.]
MTEMAVAGRRETRSVCPYCGTGCGVILEHDEKRVFAVRGDPAHPANFGALCTKGRGLAATLDRERLSSPLRRARRDAAPKRVSWHAALDEAAARFAAAIEAHGPEACAFYVSGQLSTEDYYVVNKLARGLIGTNHIDTNSRLCMASTVSAYKASLGQDSVPGCYEDLEQADLILIAGANPAFAHPILFRRIEAARERNPDLFLITIDPRRTPTAMVSDLHVALAPGTDVAFFHGLVHILMRDGRLDRDFIREHTEGFEALREIAYDYPPRRVADICHIPVEVLERAAAAWGKARAATSLWCQGLNQSSHGTDKNHALINLHLVTGHIGRPGAGPLSLTGQPNAMGGREVGGMPQLLPGHRELANEAHRAEIAALWGVPDLNPAPGLTAVPLFQAAAEGRIKALWIACTNPVVSLPETRLVDAALRAADFVVVQEAYYPTETAAYADLLLPAASFAEREAVVTNSERRISLMGKAVHPPGEARPDWEIFRDFAHTLGVALDATRVPRVAGETHALRARRLFAFATHRTVFDEYKACTEGRDLDITGLDWRELEAGPRQWPYPRGASEGRARLYTDHVFATPSGRARLSAAPYQPVAEPVSQAFPFHLTTGRLRDQWHTMSRTGLDAGLFAHDPEAVLSIHPLDAAGLGIQDGDLVTAESRRGAVTVRARAHEEVAPGTVFLPMHFGARFSARGAVNVLTEAAARDPVSNQPELKHAAVAVRKTALPWAGRLVRRLEPGLWEAARALLPELGYGALARHACGSAEALVLRFAFPEPPGEAWAGRLATLFALRDGMVVGYQDSRGVRKHILLRDERLWGFCLLGDDATGAWLQDLLLTEAEVGAWRHALVAPTVPAGAVSVSVSGRLICQCRGVGEAVIRQSIEDGARTVAAVSARCGAGAACGSCRPEIAALLGARPASPT